MSGTLGINHLHPTHGAPRWRHPWCEDVVAGRIISGTALRHCIDALFSISECSCSITTKFYRMLSSSSPLIFIHMYHWPAVARKDVPEDSLYWLCFVGMKPQNKLRLTGGAWTIWYSSEMAGFERGSLLVSGRSTASPPCYIPGYSVWDAWMLSCGILSHTWLYIFFFNWGSDYTV